MFLSRDTVQDKAARLNNICVEVDKICCSCIWRILCTIWMPLEELSPFLFHPHEAVLGTSICGISVLFQMYIPCNNALSVDQCILPVGECFQFVVHWQITSFWLRLFTCPTAEGDNQSFYFIHSKI